MALALRLVGDGFFCLSSLSDVEKKSSELAVG
jgi:hypothetical protein